MFQSFDDVTDPSVGAPRLARLRRILTARGLDGFLIPRADQHNGEYVPACWDRLRWITGFTGSAGAAVVLTDRAAAFTDGRYTLQMAAQVDGAAFERVSTVETSVDAWLARALSSGLRFGIDPWLHSAQDVERLAAIAARAGAELVLVDDNPVDEAWTDRPALPAAPVERHPDDLAGASAAEKLKRLAEAVAAAGASHLVETAPDVIAWAFNIRGGDLPHLPIALSWAIVPASGTPVLFIDPAKLDDDVTGHLSALAELRPYGAFREALEALGRAGASAIVDPAAAPAQIGRLLAGAGGKAVARTDPALLMRAAKTPAEIDGARAAHRRDGAALARFLAWFDRSVVPGVTTEIDVASALEGFRRETGALRDIAFTSIAGAGPNGAIVHYRVTRATNRAVDADSLFLIDSGGQYRDGTTDVTRTLAVGRPTAEMCRHFTLVLEGLVAVASARFPKGTTGAQLDALARRPLWTHGLDFDHGTGHGVGSYLSVHEGPQRLAKTSSVALEPGMILSDEPGYYRPGAYGIRIENLLVVTEPAPIPGGERPMLGFETLTLAPIDRRLIDASLLTPGARAFVDAYHARVLAEIGPLVDPDTRAWLERACAPC